MISCFLSKVFSANSVLFSRTTNIKNKIKLIMLNLQCQLKIVTLQTCFFLTILTTFEIRNILWSAAKAKIDSSPIVNFINILQAVF